jgi:murein DD-endopeptidase MepM/ murein hydrolase activator NlpD
VSVGQEIGGVGETGYVSQRQLHFQVRKNRQAVNPLIYLEPSNGLSIGAVHALKALMP